MWSSSGRSSPGPLSTAGRGSTSRPFFCSYSPDCLELDFSHLETKGVGYARHRSRLKEVSDAHPTHPDDTGFAPVRATVLQARLAARSGAPGWRDPRSRCKDRKLRPARDGLGPGEAANQLKALPVTAPGRLRDGLRGLSAPKLLHKAAGFRPGDRPEDVAAATKCALRSIALRYRALSEDIRELDGRLGRLVIETVPALVAVHGVDIDTAATLLVAVGQDPRRLKSEAAFAHMCGVAPIPAFSGKVVRHRPTAAAAGTPTAPCTAQVSDLTTRVHGVRRKARAILRPFPWLPSRCSRPGTCIRWNAPPRASSRSPLPSARPPT